MQKKVYKNKRCNLLELKCKKSFYNKKCKKVFQKMFLGDAKWVAGKEFPFPGLQQIDHPGVNVIKLFTLVILEFL